MNKFNDTLHKSFVKHDIYQKVQYIYNRVIYLLPTHLTRDFEILDKWTTFLMHEEDIKFIRKITGCVEWSTEYENEMDSVELWVLFKNLYGEHRYNGRQVTQLEQQFPHITSDVNEVEILTGLQSTYLGRKVTNS